MEIRNVCNPFNHRPACGDDEPRHMSSNSQRLWEGIARYFFRRAAIARLRELDDRALRDIGLTRSQIEAAVHGFTTAPNRARTMMTGSPDLTVATILVAFAGVFLICFMKGAFGGGFSIVGIPLLSIVMDPSPLAVFSRPCSSRWICSHCATGSPRHGRNRTLCCCCRDF